MALSATEEQAIHTLARQIKSLARAPHSDFGNREWPLLSREGLLNSIAEHICSCFDADGAAIALADEIGSVVCVASAGRAPNRGTPLNMESGFSAECFRTRKTLLCADTNNDSRVNRAFCQALDVRSLIAVPVYATGELGVIGIVLGVSRRQAGFTLEDEKIFRSLTTVIAQVSAARSETELSKAVQSVLDLPASIAQSYLGLCQIPIFLESDALQRSTVPNWNLSLPFSGKSGNSSQAMQRLVASLRRHIRYIAAITNFEAFKS